MESLQGNGTPGLETKDRFTLKQLVFRTPRKRIKTGETLVEKKDENRVRRNLLPEPGLRGCLKSLIQISRVGFYAVKCKKRSNLF